MKDSTYLSESIVVQNLKGIHMTTPAKITVTINDVHLTAEQAAKALNIKPEQVIKTDCRGEEYWDAVTYVEYVPE